MEKTQPQLLIAAIKQQDSLNEITGRRPTPGLTPVPLQVPHDLSRTERDCWQLGTEMRHIGHIATLLAKELLASDVHFLLATKASGP